MNLKRLIRGVRAYLCLSRKSLVCAEGLGERGFYLEGNEEQ